MKIMIGLMLALTAGLAIFAHLRGDGSLGVALRSAGAQMLGFLPIILLALVLGGLIETLLPKDVVQRWLSDAAGLRGIGLAWLAGALTPAGSLVGLPLVAGLYRAGVGVGVLITYLTSLATLSLIRVPLEVGLIGGRLAAIRIATSLFLPPLAGLAAQGVLALLRVKA